MDGQSDGTRCPECGGAIEVEQQGHLERIFCRACGWEQWATVYPADEVPLIQKS